MASTLEKLLSIQGATGQQSMETLIKAPPAAQEPAEEAGRIDTHPAAENAEKGPSEAQESAPPPQAIKSPPAMLEAWRTIYRVFTKYAPALKLAANLDDDNEEAGRLFMEALEEIKPVFAIGGDAEILALGVYNMLDDVFKKARDSGETF